jgi:hypothetical protein
MSSKGKIAIALVSLVCGIFILGAIAVYRVVSPFIGGTEIPPELKEARVLVGADFLTKSEFYKSGKNVSWRDLIDPDKLKSRIDRIENMTAGELNGQPGRDIGLAGVLGLTLLDEQGNVKERIGYQFGHREMKVGPLKATREMNRYSKMRLIDLEGDGVCEVLGFGGLDGMAVFNHQGHLTFSRGQWDKGKPSIREVAVGDVDADGHSDFIASWGYEPSAMEMFDRYGQTKWRTEEDFGPGEVEILDLTGDGKPELLEYGGTSLKVRDGQGNVINTVPMPVYLWHLSLCARPDGKGLPQNLAVRDGSTWLIDLDGKNHSKWDAPLSTIKLQTPRVEKFLGSSEEFVEDKETVYRASGAWVKLSNDPSKHFVVIANFAGIDRSLLYVYDAEGKLIYHEVLPEQCHSIVVVSADSAGGNETFLISGESTVWRYAAKVRGL